MRVVYREDQQQREHEVLSEEAAFPDGTEGRRSSSEPDALRTDYQRDRDRSCTRNRFGGFPTRPRCSSSRRGTTTVPG